MFGVVPRLQSFTANAVSGSPAIKGFVEHPAGPFTIHFWAPTAKWLISAANIADLNRPVEKMSANQQSGEGTRRKERGVCVVRASNVCVPEISVTISLALPSVSLNL